MDSVLSTASGTVGVVRQYQAATQEQDRVAAMARQHETDTRSLRAELRVLRTEVEQARAQSARARDQLAEATARATDAENTVRAQRDRMAQAEKGLLERMASSVKAQIANEITVREQSLRITEERAAQAESAALDAEEALAAQQADHDSERRQLEQQLDEERDAHARTMEAAVTEARAQDAARMAALQQQIRDAQAQWARMQDELNRSKQAVVALQASQQQISERREECEQEVQRA